MFQKIDCVRIHVSSVDAALAFYQEKLGLELAWRRGESEAGLKLQNSDTELVLVREELEHAEVDVLVRKVDQDARDFQNKGGKIVVKPFDIPVGRCAVVQDPWNNEFALLDLSKGLLKTDSKNNVISPS